jgi:hypothetical protein
MLRLEIVSHCWNYARLLSYQLSSLVLYPPRDTHVTVTVFYNTDDSRTRRVLECFDRHRPDNVHWHWWHLERGRLFRRAIGRNLAALASRADWVWFADCDHIFRNGCLDELAAQIVEARESLYYPETVRTCAEEHGDSLVELNAAGMGLWDIDPMYFRPLPYNRAIGGVQIARGELVRQTGYCKNVPQFQQPAETYQRSKEDVRFREILGTDGTPLALSNVFRIQHTLKGRNDPSAML